MTTPITVVPVASPSSATPRPPKTAPRKDATKLAFQFAPSKPGAQDRNLLILLHGLGDTSAPFFELGRKLALPSTAVLSVQAPLQIPLFDEPAFMYYPSFTLPDFLPEPRPDPTRILADLAGLVAHLEDCGWAAQDVHWLGFGQGASVAAEFALSHGRAHAGARFGSLVDVVGPLLSHPTTQVNNGTPLLVLHRPAPSSALSPADLAALKRGFKDVSDVKFKSGEGMPRGPDEWRVVMAFWARHLAREESGMGGGGEMYEVLSGGPRVP